MSNRFHSKWHRRNHHTYGNDTNPDASHDPIASQQQPFLGEFVLKGALSATCPLSSFAAFLYTDNTALCAYAGTRGAYIHSEGYLGLEVISTKSIGISANAPKIAIEALSPMRAISAWGGQIGLDVYSPTRAISAFGGRIGGEFYSPVRALSAYGGQIGLDVYSSSRGISSYGGFIGGEFYSPVRALSAWGGQIGLDVYSSNWGVNSYGNIMGVGAYSNNVALSAYGALTGIKAEGGNVAASFHSPMISLSTGGGGINVFNSRVGIYKVPQPYYPQQGSQVVLDVNGDVRIDGNATITGDLSALGTFSYFDTKVQITSSLIVNNKGTDAATTIIQTGAYPILQCFDQDINDSKASLMVDGAKNGWVGIGVNSPTASFNIVKANTATEANGQPQVRIYDGTTNKIAIGTFGTNASNPYIGSENSVPFDIVTNNTQKVTVLSNGNVGINHASPTAKLAIFGDSNGTTALSAYGSAFGAIIAGGDTRINYNGSGSTYINTNNAVLTNVNIGNSNANGTNLNLAGYVKINDGNITTLFKDTEINYNGSTGTVRIGNNSAGIVMAGAPVGINNNTSTTTNTNIGTGSTTGTVNIGNAVGTLTLNGNTGSIITASTFTINGTTGRALNINNTTAATTNINTGTGNVTTTIGNAGTIDINGSVAVTIDGPTTINGSGATNTTNIGTGTTTGKITIGNTGLTGGVELDGSPVTINENAGTYTTNITTGTTTGLVTIGNNTAGASTTISGATTTLNGTVVSVNGTTVNVGSATTTTLNIGTLAGLTITEGSSTGDHVLNSDNLTAPNQVVNANFSVLNRIAGDTRYAPLVKNTTLGSVNTTITLSNIVGGVALEASSIYEITAVAVLSIAGNAAIVGSRVAFEGDGALSFYYHSIDEMSFNSASHTTHANITYSGVGTNNITIAPNLTLTVATNNTQHHYRRRMTIRTGLAGTLLWRHGVHTAGGTNSSTPALGSILFARKIS